MCEGTKYKCCAEPSCSRKNMLLSLDDFYRVQGGKFGR